MDFVTIAPWLIGICVSVLCAGLAYIGFTSAQEKVANRNSLKAIEDYTYQGDQIIAKERPFVERVLLPMGSSLTGLSSRLTPSGYIDKTRYRLAMAGRRGPDELNKFLLKRMYWAGAGILLVVVAVTPLFGDMAMARIGVLILGIIVATIGADQSLKEEMKKRQKQVRRSLPDILDLLSISVEAGLGFEQAIDRITSAVPGPLSDEFQRMMGEMRAGSSRADALIAMDERIGVEVVKSFVLAMVQADQFGVSIGRVLKAQADEMRIKRRQLAQEAAQKAPVKMLFPMVFLIFPALFVVILGPAGYNIMTEFSK